MTVDPDRRSFLLKSKNLLYAGAGVALAGGAAWRSLNRNVFSLSAFPASEYLAHARSKYGVSPGYFCAAGALAPSIVNSQPWEFRITDNQILVFADLTRRAPALDQFARQLFFSVGCAVTNIEIAAAAHRKSANVSVVLDEQNLRLEEGGLVLAAQIDLGDGPLAKKSAGLFEQIPLRRTNRHSHDLGNSIPDSHVNAVMKAAESPETQLAMILYTEPRHIELAALFAKAIRAQFNSPETRGDAARWFRCTKAGAWSKGDGILIDGLGISPIYLPAWKFWRCPTPERLAEFNTDIVVGRGAFSNFLGALMVPEADTTLSTAVRAGRAWQRMALTASRVGLALQPVSAIPEAFGDPEGEAGKSATKKFQEVVRQPGWRPALGFRMGRATARGTHSVRRDLDSVITG